MDIENLITIRQYVESDRNKGRRGKPVTESWVYKQIWDYEKGLFTENMPFKFKKIAGHYYIIDEKKADVSNDKESGDIQS